MVERVHEAMGTAHAARFHLQRAEIVGDQSAHTRGVRVRSPSRKIGCHIEVRPARHLVVIIKSIIGSVFALGTVAQMASATPSQLTNEQWLMPSQALTSSCYYRATMQPDGNLVLSSNGTASPYWSTGTAGRGAYARMQSDGNFVVYNWADNPVWAASTRGARVVMQVDGNLVVYNASNSPLWSSNTAGESIASTNCYGSNFALTDVYAGWNASGGDYTHFTLGQARASWCAYYCSQDSRCKTFTYVPPGIQGSQAVCWLKDRAVSWYADSRMVSGVIVH